MEHARFDLPFIRAWAEGGGNLAVRTGRVSSVFVLDVDRHGEDDGFETLAAQGREPPPETYTVETPRGGRHYYFFAPADFEVHSSSGALGPGVDIMCQRLDV